MKKSVNSLIGFIIIILNLKIILKKFLIILNLTKAQVFYIYKLIKVIKIHEYQNFLLLAL